MAEKSPNVPEEEGLSNETKVLEVQWQLESGGQARGSWAEGLLPSQSLPYSGTPQDRRVDQEKATELSPGLKGTT